MGKVIKSPSVQKMREFQVRLWGGDVGRTERVQWRNRIDNQVWEWNRTVRTGYLFQRSWWVISGPE